MFILLKFAQKIVPQKITVSEHVSTRTRLVLIISLFCKKKQDEHTYNW